MTAESLRKAVADARQRRAQIQRDLVVAACKWDDSERPVPASARDRRLRSAVMIYRANNQEFVGKSNLDIAREEEAYLGELKQEAEAEAEVK